MHICIYRGGEEEEEGFQELLDLMKYIVCVAENDV